MKKVLSIILCIALLAAILAVPAAANTTDETIDGGYYIVFKENNYELSESNRLHGANDYYWLGGLSMNPSTPFKIAYSLDLNEIAALYPEGEGNDYVPRYDSSFYTVEFIPSGSRVGDSSDMAWYDGYVSAFPCEPPQEEPTIYITYDGMKQNRYEDAFSRYLPNWQEICTYDEVYYHGRQNDGPFNNDWVLVYTEPLEPVCGDNYGVFDDMVYCDPQYCPFEFSYGVYDCGGDAYYSITDAWNMGYDGLHSVFTHILKTGGAAQLGDADNDGDLTIIDATCIQRFLAGIMDLESSSWWFEFYNCSFGTPLTSLADYDDDGEVSIIDATRIQRTLAGNELYPHAFTASARLEESGPAATVRAASSFGAEPVEYLYTIKGVLHAHSASAYGNDFGKFHVAGYDDEYTPEPGDFIVTTGYISDSQVEIPVSSLTYNDNFVLTVRAKDAAGKETELAAIYFKNVF